MLSPLRAFRAPAFRSIMRTAENRTSTEFVTDAELVSASREGDREAFGRSVERYQRLLCSLAYAANGRLSESEDLAQEVFVEAWRQLHALREPEKLRAWLCGILRHKVSRLRRSDDREPAHRAEALELADEIPSGDEPTPDRAMGKEEQAILWRALERVPEQYREPMVLYYREHCSVEHVAVALDLTEDAVKQRLSRGRKILQEGVLAFVEGALSRSTPGRVFTLSVLAALPAIAPSAEAAGMSAVAVKGGMAAKASGLAGLVVSLSGVVSAVLTLRTNLDQARTPRERRAVVRITLALFSVAFAWLGSMYLLRSMALRAPEPAVMHAWMSQGLVLGFVVGWPWILVRAMRGMRALRSAERRAHPELFIAPRDQAGSSVGEYRSRWTLLGVPLIRIRFSAPDAGDPPVFGWIAGGDRAFGILFAWGGIAVAPISLGAVAIGCFAVGSLSLGWISFGTVGVGFVAVGCMAAGIKAYGWLSALGWETASGSGFAIARFSAEGPLAWARHANDAVAAQILADPQAGQGQLTVITVITLLSLVPVILYARAVRKRLG